MALEEDPYLTLGVPPSASAGEIRTAWRRTALDTHPDRNPGNIVAERRFKAAAAAYELLGDPRRRAAWDAWDAARRSQGAPPPPSGPQVRPREPARRQPHVHPARPLDPSVAGNPDAAVTVLLERARVAGTFLLFAGVMAICGYAGGGQAVVLHGAAVAVYIGLHPRNVPFDVVHGWQLAVLLTGLGGALIGWL